MDISIATLEDLKKLRPDLYLAVKEEIFPPKRKYKKRVSKNDDFDISNYNRVIREAMIRDLVQRKSNGLVGEVIDIKVLSPSVKRLIVKNLSGIKSGIVNDISTYYVLEEKAEG